MRQNIRQDRRRAEQADSAYDRLVAQFWATIDADDDPADRHIPDEDIYE